MVTIRTTVNHSATTFDAHGGEAAVAVLRDRLGLTGTKLVCGSGVCGACTVSLDGTPVVSCLLPATSIEGRQVTTIEGVGNGSLHPVQRAFIVHDALQCGYCTPGFVVEAIAFVDRWRSEHGSAEPDRHVIADALAGHLCRCGAYEAIYRAVRAACRGDFDTESNAVGPRVEAIDKVTGRATYTTDVVRPGMLHGVIVRAPVASGVLLRIDLAALRAAPGVDAAVRLAGRDGVIRYAGQPLAAVAADSRERAVEACRAAMFDIESRPSVCDVDHAMTDDAPLVHAGRAARKAAPSSAENPLAPAVWKGNRRGPSTVRWRGFTAARRLRAASSSADQFLVDQTYTTAVQVHTPLEPHACVAEWTSSGELHLWLSTQAMAHVGRLAAEYFDLPPERVTVTAEHVGGGFGAKLSLSPDIVAAVELSRAAKAPVRVVLDRHEELAVGGLRPGTRTRVELLADRRGDLQAMRIDSHGDGGVSVGSTVAGLGALMYGRGPRIVRDADVVTHAPPGTPFRGPGGPPMAWALEQAVDQMAHRLDVDPIVLRQRWDGNPKRKALYQWAAELPAWRERGPVGGSTGRFRRGVGVAAANWFYFVDPGTEVTVRVHEGRLRVECSTQDMGTGSRSVLAAGVAEVFGIDRSEVSSMIEVIVGHSGHGHGPVSGGSRTTVSIHPTAVEAATKLKAIVGDRHSLARHEGACATATRGKDFRRRILPVTMRDIQMGRGFSGAVHISEVEVDTRTGKVRALHVWGGIAVGRIVSHELARAQCEGSVIQGIGFALYEQRVLDPSTGHVLTANLEDYRIPQLGDTPEIDIHFHEHGWEHVPGGGIGLGEVATVGVAASIGNAIHHATGWRPLDLPVRPDRVLAGLS